MLPAHQVTPALSGKRFRCAAVALAAAVPLFAGSATAWADDVESITLDFVRHGQSLANAEGLLSTEVPGPELTELGQQEAQAVAEVLQPGAPYAGLYDSELIRTQETAAPLAEALHMRPETLPGLNEIGAGIYQGADISLLESLFHGGSLGAVSLPEIVGTFEGLLYGAAPFLWTLGLLAVPIPFSTDPNGAAFDESFGAAVQTIYDNTVASTTGSSTDVAFSSQEAISTWTMLNVNNPDPLLTLTDMLPNTGIVVVDGSPQDGWTLVSWDGRPIGPASLPTQLFVDVRDLLVAPQLAAYNIWQAVLTGDPTTIVEAMLANVGDVGAAVVQFPVSVIDDIVNALRDSLSTVTGTDPADVLPAAAGVAGLLPGELGTAALESLAAL
ncbi:histidine phosphatase family protein [Mycobacterium sp.]|uniref:histidine phosphatase family protein n=1 Tax=Mycobacterium sp. TaxID=1785 RepID=UPI0025D72247|nr:histidine phosphatase family protein [Mycobacterium sp.]